MRSKFRRVFCSAIMFAVLVTTTLAFAAGPNLVAAFFVKGKVGLKWQKMDGVDEYRIYRKPTSGDFEMIGTSGDDHYFDTDITPGTTYQYKVAIVDESGAEVFSGLKTVTIPGQVGDFVSPVWVGARVDQGKVLLNWDEVAGAIAYNIYRSETPGANYEVVGNSQATTHADKADLESGTTYYYVLTAMNQEFEETPYSEEMSVKFGVSAEERESARAKELAIQLDDIKLTHVTDLVSVGGGEMNQPADVYSNSRGQIFVTDALNSQVHCFDSDKYLLSFGRKATGKNPAAYENGSFKIPFTIYIDDRDQVYVADIGRNDIQVFAADGTFLRRIVVEMEKGQEALRANGMCLIDHNRLAVTDTGNHRLLIIDMDGNILSEIGKRGSAPGEFVYPGEIERSADGELFVLDVINNRVQVLDLDGNFIRAFGKAGEGVGLFGRPAGLALAPDGRVWVSDNMSALIQSFTPQGDIKFVMGSAQDEWHFVAPRGIHFVGNRLYVVDRLSNKVIVYDLN